MELQVHRAEEITRLHQEIIGNLRTSLEKAIKIDELLTEQKNILKHGDFMPWVKAEIPFTDRTARNYMRLYRERDKLETETVSDLTDAYRLLAEPKKITAEQMTKLIMAIPEGEEGIQAKKRLMSYVDAMDLDEVGLLLNEIAANKFDTSDFPRKCPFDDESPDPCKYINDVDGCWRCHAKTALALEKKHLLERPNENYTIQ